MIDYSSAYAQMDKTRIYPWAKRLRPLVEDVLVSDYWGADLARWENVLKSLPDIKPSYVDLNADCITIGKESDCTARERELLERSLRELCPWRKGPFNVFGIHIDAEWRSDFKWARLKDHIAPLEKRLVLDVGCGNGYYCLRIAGQNPRFVIGIDPMLIYVSQFYALQKYLKLPHTAVFPIGIEKMPEDLNQFDTVFSMGLLYHRRAPVDHLLQLKSLLREGGELVLETLVIDGKEGDVLSASERYAMMANVWFIPSVLTLESWLKRCGYQNIKLIDVSKTTPDEQRTSGWMTFQSLENHLDPKDRNKTVEGYPAPIRALFIAQNES